MIDTKTARCDKAPDETAELRAETAELQARYNSLRTQNEALARRAACLEAERDAAREACRILERSCQFSAGFFAALEGWVKTEAQAGCAASMRSGLEMQMAEAHRILRGER